MKTATEFFIFLLLGPCSLLDQPSENYPNTCKAPEGCCSFLGQMFPADGGVVAILEDQDKFSTITLHCHSGPTIQAELQGPLGINESYSISNTNNTTTTTTTTPTTTTKSPVLIKNITSPNYPENYDNNIDNWTRHLEVPAGEKLKLTFKDFDIEDFGCHFDWVEVRYEGFQSGRLCGRKTPGPFISSTNTMNISFHSDYRDTHRGFRAEYEPTKSSSNNSEACTCGIENGNDSRFPTFRVINGNETQENQYPWMVRLTWKNGGPWLCGGTLISSKYVLTAAHCVTNEQNVKVPSSSVKVTIGDHHISMEIIDDLEKKINVTNIIVHQSYIKVEKPFNMENDIALLELSEDVDLTIYTPACLPSSGENFVGKQAIATGWGTTEKNETSMVLRSVDLTVFEGEKTGFLTTYGGPERHGACMGDSGGPLTYQKGHQHTVIGVASYVGGAFRDENGRPIGCTGAESHFSSVAYYRDWIEEKMKASKFCKT